MTEPICLSRIERIMRIFVQHYNHDKYWRRRKIVTDPHSRVPKWLRMYYLFYIKRSDAFNNASMGTHMGFGAEFITPPNLPHGLNGIIVSHTAKIGRNCTIYHQVTLGGGRNGGAPQLGDNVTVGAGAKVFNGVKIGDNVLIGGGPS